MKSNYCDQAQSCCCNVCSHCTKEFQQLLDLEGLDKNRDDTTDIPVNDSSSIVSGPSMVADTSTIQNTQDELLASSKYLTGLDAASISCKRCRQIIEHARKLLQKIPVIEKYVIKGICDHCKLKYRPCFECQEAISNLLGTKNDESKAKDQMKEWLSQVRNLLRDAFVKEEQGKKREDVRSELNIRQTYSRGITKAVSKSGNKIDSDVSKAIIISIKKEMNMKLEHEQIVDSTGEDRHLDFSIDKEIILGEDSRSVIYTGVIPKHKDRKYKKEKHVVVLSDVLPVPIQSDEVCSIPKDYYSLINQDRITRSSQSTPSRTINGEIFKDFRNIFKTRSRSVDRGLSLRGHDEDILSHSIRQEEPRLEFTKFSKSQDNIFSKASESSVDIKTDDDTKYFDDNNMSVKHRVSRSDKLYWEEIRKISTDVPGISTHLKGHPKDSVSTAAERYGEMSKDFSFIFPRQIEVKHKIRNQKTSSELIKETMDMLNIRAQEKGEILEEERLKRAEEEQRKRLAREERASEKKRITDEKKRLVEEKLKVEEEKRNDKEQTIRREEIKKESKKNSQVGASETRNIDITLKNKQEKTKKEDQQKKEKATLVSATVNSMKQNKKSKPPPMPQLKDKPKLESKESKDKSIQNKSHIDKEALKAEKDAENRKRELEMKENEERVKMQREAKQRDKDEKERLKKEHDEHLKKEKYSKDKDLKDKEENKKNKMEINNTEGKERKKKEIIVEKKKEKEEDKNRKIIKEKQKDIQEDKKKEEPLQTTVWDEIRPKSKEKKRDPVVPLSPNIKSELPVPKDINANSIKIRKMSQDDLILRLVRLKQNTQIPQERLQSRRVSKIMSPQQIKAHKKGHNYMKELECAMCIDSDLEIQHDSKLEKKVGPEDIIVGQKILKYRPPLIQNADKGDQEMAPLLFQSNFLEMPSEQIDSPLEEKEKKSLTPGKQAKTENDQEPPKGVIRYALSDRSFIDKGWTLLPTEKVVRKMNVYRMRPAHPEFDWFEHNKNKRLIQYDTGEKMAEFDDNGRGRWYYRNGRLALDYYDAEELNAQQRFVVYSNGEPDERGRSRPYTILATFDYLGNGIVFDHSGKIRLKYNQTEGVVLDRNIGPVSHWKWHTLNDPPVLQQVMIDTQIAHKDPLILKMGGPHDDKTKQDNEEMLAIEFDNFIKEKSKKLSQTFKPFQIKMKALKINENFSLKVLDQATVYLIFRDGTTNLKLNIGMILDHKEIVDTDTAEVGEVSNNLERFPAITDSLAELQKSVAYATRFERNRTERERRLRPPEPCGSADKLTAAASRPLRCPLRTVPSASTATSARNNCNCKCTRKPPSNNVYYDSRLL